MLLIDCMSTKISCKKYICLWCYYFRTSHSGTDFFWIFTVVSAFFEGTFDYGYLDEQKIELLWDVLNCFITHSYYFHWICNWSITSLRYRWQTLGCVLPLFFFVFFYNPIESTATLCILFYILLWWYYCLHKF